MLANRIEGKVAKIGETGNLITDIPVAQISDIPHDESVTIAFGDHSTVSIFPAEHDQPDATMVASFGKSGFLEIEIVGISLADMLGIQVNEAVRVAW